MVFKLGCISESPGKLGLSAKDSASVVLGWNPGIFFVINSALGDCSDGLTTFESQLSRKFQETLQMASSIFEPIVQ